MASKKRYDVDESEEIARVLFSPSMIDGDDRISRNAFFLERLPSGDWDEYLSVWRTLYKIPTRENASFINPRTSRDKLFGYGTLTVKGVHSSYEDLKVSAKVYRTKSNPKEFHVGIFYTLDEVPIKGECHDADFIELTMNLANQAILTKFPPLDSDTIQEAI